MDDKLIDKINNLVKSQCSRVPHNIGLDVLKLVEKHQEQLTLSGVSQQRELLQAFQEKYNEENTDEDVQIYDHHIDDFLNSL